MTSRIGSKTGFTLIEVMMAVAVLSFGIVVLFQSFFICVDSVQYASNRLKAQLWLDAKMWEEADVIMRTNATALGETSGTFSLDGREFSWVKSAQAVDTDLFGLTIDLSWKEAGKQRLLAYSTFLTP